MSYSTTHIGHHIKNYVTDNNTTIGALADRLELSRATLYEKMNGTRRWYIDEAIRLAEVIGCEVTDLLIEPAENP